MTTIIKYIDDYLSRTGLPDIDPVEANAILAKAGILCDSKDRPGKPLRDLLRKGQLPHAFQSGGKGSSWIIPHSCKLATTLSNYPTSNQPKNKIISTASKAKSSITVDIAQLIKQLEKARLKYKPDIVRYLLIAEAPPDSIERFFYYDNVHQHDYLFLGVAQTLYPHLKETFLASGRSSEIKNSILLKLKADGFYLLDLSELPLSLLNGDLYSQLPNLIEKLNQVANKQTNIILIKATVYDTAFQHLQGEGFENIVEVRIPFPGQGGQKLFQTKFHEALKLVGYL
jgi:hypothetical protein